MQDLYLLMDETDAPYDKNEIVYDNEDDADLAEFAIKHGLEFRENSPFQKYKKNSEKL
ncbi:MAG: hypothetical protein ILP08_08785 [Lachnospiraceae bacterium]|nr:hypothetical protein [Lachnospiraceae bacterium]